MPVEKRKASVVKAPDRDHNLWIAKHEEKLRIHHSDQKELRMTYVPNEAEQELIAALRSGEFKQCTGKLAKRSEVGDIGYCCLGVACELHVRKNNLQSWKTDSLPRTDGLIPIAYNGSPHYLPEEIQQKLRWSTREGHLKLGFPTSAECRHMNWDSLASANDGGLPFSVIADFIEKGYVWHVGESRDYQQEVAASENS